MIKFYFHYNKPEADKCGSPKLNVCIGEGELSGDYIILETHIVDHITCQVPIVTWHKASHPVCVLAGTASAVRFCHGPYGLRAIIL